MPQYSDAKIGIIPKAKCRRKSVDLGSGGAERFLAAMALPNLARGLPVACGSRRLGCCWRMAVWLAWRRERPTAAALVAGQERYYLLRNRLISLLWCRIPIFGKHRSIHAVIQISKFNGNLVRWLTSGPWIWRERVRKADTGQQAATGQAQVRPTSSNLETSLRIRAYATRLRSLEPYLLHAPRVKATVSLWVIPASRSVCNGRIYQNEQRIVPVPERDKLGPRSR